MGAPENRSTPNNPPAIGPKPTSQRQNLSLQGQSLDLEASLDSTAPELNRSRPVGLDRQNAFDHSDEIEQPTQDDASHTADTQGIIDAIGENTLLVTQFISELADRVKNLETSVNETN